MKMRPHGSSDRSYYSSSSKKKSCLGRAGVSKKHVAKRCSRMSSFYMSSGGSATGATSSSLAPSGSRRRNSSLSSSPSTRSSISPHRTSKVNKQMRELFLTKVKTIRSKAQLNTTKLFEEITCAVCKFSLHDPYTILPCQHSFCNWCLTEWLKQSASCPMCRCKPTMFRKDRDARAKVEHFCRRLSPDRQQEMGFGRKLTEQQFCLVAHKMTLAQFLQLVPDSAASQKEAEARREREFRAYEVEIGMLRVRIESLRSQQNNLMRRRRRQLNTVMRRFETELEYLDAEEEILNHQLEQFDIIV